MMNDEIKEMKIGMYTTDEILEHLTEGEGRSFLGRSMYDAITDYITNLQKENEKLKKELNDISNISYKDYSVWATERRYLDTLDEFANDIKYKIAPNLTDSYRDGIKLALKHTIKYVKDNYKQETLEDYKSRVEKAVEYIKQHCYFDDGVREYMDVWEVEHLLNILQNGSDDNV